MAGNATEGVVHGSEGRAFDASSQLDALGDLIDSLRDAVMVLDARGRLVLANARARALLDRGDALALDDERCVHAPLCEPPLSALLDSAHGTGVISPREARAHPLVVRVRHRAPDRIELWVTLSGGQTPPDTRWLSLAYGLTEAELRVVTRLAEGHKTDAIADALGVSVGTVRNQLKQAFAKTGVNSQAALVALVLASEPRLRRLKRSGDERC